MNIEEMEYDIKADCRIPDIDPNHFAYVSMSAEEAWNLIQYDPETKFEFLCNGTNRNGIKCNALLIPKKEEHENKTRYKFILQKGQHHTPGCSHIPLVERLSYSTPDFSMTDFHNALKQGKAIEPTGISGNDRFLLKEPSNIDELYEKLSSAPKHAITKDGYRVSDVFIDSRSYMLHRTGTIKPDQCPKLAIISTSGEVELKDEFDKLYDKENLLSIVTQDPFIEDGTNPSDRLLFILLISLKRISVYEAITRQLGYASRKQSKMGIPKSDREANQNLFLVENLWRAPNENERTICKGRNCYVGVITNGKQFANLTIKRSKENLSELDNRFRNRYVT